MRIDGAIAFPHSLGLYYSAVTQYLGFLKFGDEYKVMGLAAYGQPAYLESFRDILHFNPNGGDFGFQLGLDYFTHHRTGPEMSWADSDQTPTLGKMFSDEMPRFLEAPARQPEEPLEQRHRDMAASLQARLEEVYLGMLKKLAAKTGAKAVCLAGGVAFNCVANGKIFDATPFEQVYVHPAAGDAGLAVGAAYYVWHQILGKPRSFVLEHAYWGPGYSHRGNAVCGASKRRFREVATRSPNCRRTNCSDKPPPSLPMGKSSAGIKAVRSGGRARSAIAASWPIRADRR